MHLHALESQGLSVLTELHSCLVNNRFGHIPAWPVLWRFGIACLVRPFFRRRAWYLMAGRWLESSGITNYQPREALPLLDLWERTSFKQLEPRLVERDTLWFEQFVVCRRDSGFRLRNAYRAEYLAVYPSGKVPFRAVARDSSHRRWIARHAACYSGAPTDNDFRTIRVKTLGFDVNTCEMTPGDMTTFLSGLCGPWELLSIDSHASAANEEIVSQDE